MRDAIRHTAHKSFALTTIDKTTRSPITNWKVHTIVSRHVPFGFGGGRPRVVIHGPMNARHDFGPVPHPRRRSRGQSSRIYGVRRAFSEMRDRVRTRGFYFSRRRSHGYEGRRFRLPSFDMRSGPRRDRRQQRARCAVPGYEIVKPLKTGGMSDAVNLVKNQRSGKLYVEKRIVLTNRNQRRTAVGLAALKRVRGSHLNVMFDHIWQPGICSFILEYCDSGSLDQKIEDLRRYRHSISETFAWHVLLGLAKALSFLHYGVPGDAILHLDIKPQNVLLSTDGRSGSLPRVILADFGCAVMENHKRLNFEHPQVQMCGTPEWYPPEGLYTVVGRALARYGKETDIYALGATIHVLCRSILGPPKHRELWSSDPCGRKYGDVLNAAVALCTKRDWRQRISALKLIQQVEKFGPRADRRRR